MIEDKMRPIHPGEILREDFMVPLKMKPAAFATVLDLPLPVLSDVLNEKRSISAEIAAHIVRHFGGHVDFWLRLQKSYDDKTASLKPGQPGPARPAASS
ncbi:addiction module HigA family antidote [Duganella sp. 1224]|uniref:HigA family addiction module antitoxin n=1 Tax=Duganella sp. 1224 TaxID=2587052 RepID=UPI0017B2E50A|nr:HigA family addiction module antitoxin [Duganella sp. 1224]NYE63354.1 addiction module HigA family antidote [Duganella sp. 1224]